MTHYLPTPLVAESRYGSDLIIHRPPPYRGGWASLAAGALVAGGWLVAAVLDPLLPGVEEMVETSATEPAEGETGMADTTAAQIADLVSRGPIDPTEFAFYVSPPPVAPLGPVSDEVEPNEPATIQPSSAPSGSVGAEVEPNEVATTVPPAATALTATTEVSEPETAPGPSSDVVPVTDVAEGVTSNETHVVAAGPGNDVDSQNQVAELILLGINDPRTIKRWLADRVVAITVSTSRGTFVAAVPDALAGTATPYENLEFTRPGTDATDQGTVLSSNMRLRFAGVPPVDRDRLVTALTLKLGGVGVEDLAVHFTGAAANRILSAQAEALATLSGSINGTRPMTPADLVIDICIIDAIPKIDMVTDRATGEVLLRPGQCNSG